MEAILESEETPKVERRRPRFFTADENPEWLHSSSTSSVETVKITPRLNSETISSILIRINEKARLGTTLDVIRLIDQQIWIGQISPETLFANALSGAWHRDFYYGECEAATDICISLQHCFPQWFTSENIADRLIGHARAGCWWMFNFLFKVSGSTFANKSDVFLTRALIYDETLFRSDAVYRAECINGFKYLVDKLPDRAFQRNLLLNIRRSFEFRTFPLLQSVADYLQQKINAVCAQRNGTARHERLRIAGK